jgi:outer membrane protein assembly factor BamE (lipoprotein component of BamABCDE complex)
VRLLTLLRRLSALAPVLLVLLAGCGETGVFAYPPQTRGNKVDLEILAQLVPGTSSRADAMALLGSPTARATFDDNTWIYIGEVTKPRIGGTLQVQDQLVVVLSFDQRGTLTGIERRGMDDSAKVAVIDRATPSPGNNASILQQLLGNVGRFAPTPAATGNSNGTGGAGSANRF